MERSKHLPRTHGAIRLAVLIGLFVVAATVLSAILDIDRDEWYSLHTTSGGLAYAYRTAVGYEAIPPAYPVLLDVWRGINASVLFARLFSTLAVAGAIALGWRLAARTFSTVSPIWLAAAIAIAPFSIFAAVDIRLYALVLLMSAALAITFYDGFLAPAPRRGSQYAHALLAAFSLYVQYYVGAQIAGEFAVLALTRREMLRAYVPTIVACFVAVVPLLSLVKKQMSVVRDTSLPFGAFHGTMVGIVEFLLPKESLWHSGALKTIGFWYPAVCAVALVLFVLGRPRLNDTVRTQAVLVLTMAAFFSIVPPLFRQTLIFPRHIATLLVPSLFLGFAVADSFAVRGRALRASLFALYAALAVAELAIVYAPLTKEDYRRVAEFLERSDRDRAPIYIFDQEMVNTIGLYYHGDAPLRPIPQPMRYDRFDLDDFVLRSERQVRTSLAAVRPGERIWLFLSGNCFEPNGSDPFGCERLRDVVSADYRTLAAHPFHHAEVFELERR